MLENCNLGPFPDSLLKPGVKSRLETAILQNDHETFRAVLVRECPDIADDDRLFGVVKRTLDGMIPVMVDKTGVAIAQNYVIAQGTPLHLLNLEMWASGCRITIGDESWELPFS
jgi:hypothetical protein